MSWLESARNASVFGVAQQLGLPTAPPRGSSGGVILRCPLCNGERDATHPYRGSRGVGIRPDDRGWCCFACDQRGDAIALACAALGGNLRYKLLSRDAQQRVKAFFVGVAASPASSAPLMSLHSPAARVAPPIAKSTRVPALLSERRARGEIGPAPQPSNVPDYPPFEQIDELFTRGWVPVGADRAVREYCRHREPRWRQERYHIGNIEDRGLACALRRDFRMPEWGVFGRRSWWEAGFRLLVPLFDHTGQLRSVVARNVFRNRNPSVKGIKSIPPKGFKRSGLLVMCPFARRIMLAGAHPLALVDELASDACPFDDVAPWWDPTWPLEFRLYEGESDFLAAASWQGDAEAHQRAMLGQMEGSWSQAWADRLPAAPHGAAPTKLFVVEDDDSSGAKKTERVRKTVRSLVKRRELRFFVWNPRDHHRAVSDTVSETAPSHAPEPGDEPGAQDAG